ncbi:MAG: BBP7 family outer membrane beta-barrel protein [Pirellulales bacterium]
MATTQSFRRLAAIVLTVAASGVAALPAIAGQNWMPLLPDQDFYDFQLFAPPDLQEYAIRQDPREGFFFTYDRTIWAVTPPQARPILNDFFIPVQPLSPFAVAQLNNNLIRSGYPGSGLYVFGSDPLRLDLNTNWMRTNVQWGNRFEGGWIYDDYGMLFNYYASGPDSQSFVTTNSFAVNSPTTTFSQTVASGGGGLINGGLPLVVTTITSESPPPDHIITQSLTQRNSTELTSAGFAWAVRRNLSTAGSGEVRTMRFTAGPRYLQVADRYSIDYGSTQTPFPPDAATETAPPGGAGSTAPTGVTNLQFGGWDTSSYNNIVGPEFGLNYVFDRGRWSIETDLRFTAGMNWQNTLYRGSNFPAALGADYFRSTYTFANTVAQGTNASSPVAAPPLFVQIFGVGQTNATNNAEHNFVFAPLGEWRLKGRYKVSQAISLNVGYTGMWLGGITRASTNTSFEPSLKPVLVATQNGQPIQSPVLDAAGNVTGYTPVTSWTPPPVNQPPSTSPTSNNQLRVYNSVGPRAGNDLGYLFVNGVDFGIEINY